MIKVSEVTFRDGLVPAIVTDARSGAVLTLAYMNEESLQRTIDSGETWFWSRSRSELWHKGATSGNRQRVVSIASDCDQDALLVRVIPEGPACHTGARSCFGDSSLPQLERLTGLLAERRRARPEGSYSTYLFDAGLEKILKKVGEEATEVVIAAAMQSRERMLSEVTDLVYHLSVLLVEQGCDWSEVLQLLLEREQPAAPGAQGVTIPS